MCKSLAEQAYVFKRTPQAFEQMAKVRLDRVGHRLLRSDWMPRNSDNRNLYIAFQTCGQVLQSKIDFTCFCTTTVFRKYLSLPDT